MQLDFGDTLVDVFEKQVAANPDSLLYEFIKNSDFNSETLTYSELHQKVLINAGHLIANGLKVGDRALLIYPPGLELIVNYFACLYAGIIAVPVYPPVNAKLIKKMQYIIMDSTPAVILTTSKFKELIDLIFNPLPEYIKKPLALIYSKVHTLKNPVNHLLNLLPKNKNTLYTDEFKDLISFNRPDINENSLAFLQYTSGSTNKPRGVKISHKNLMHNLSLAAIPWKNSLNGVCWLPPYHDMGLIAGIIFPMVMNLPMRLFSPMQFLRSPIDWLELVSKHERTSTIAPNFAYEYSISKINDDQKKALDLSQWEMAWNGAEPVRMSTIDRFSEFFAECGFKKSTFAPCYGLAEATILISINTEFQSKPCLMVNKQDLQNNIISFDTSPATGIVNVGTMYQKTCIVNPETCEKLNEDELGEIWVHSDSVSDGYWNNPKETDKVFHGIIKGDTSKTKYLRTGDLGFIHDSDLYVTGRIKDLIILRGKNYYPHDIELFIEHTSDVIRKGCIVAFAVDKNNQEYLTIVCESETDNKKEFAKVAKDICKCVAKEFSFFPDTIAFIPKKTLPKTTSGKVQRQFTKKLFLSGALKISYLWKHSKTSKKLKIDRKI